MTGVLSCASSVSLGFHGRETERVMMLAPPSVAQIEHPHFFQSRRVILGRGLSSLTTFQAAARGQRAVSSDTFVGRKYQIAAGSTESESFGTE